MSPFTDASRVTAIVKSFGCRPGMSGRPGVKGPASESLRRRNPREAAGQLAVYGDLARQQRCRGMVWLGIAEG
jgi:hypothetical protein